MEPFYAMDRLEQGKPSQSMEAQVISSTEELHQEPFHRFSMRLKANLIKQSQSESHIWRFTTNSYSIIF
jgi:hypothetical protein